jgi:hypothetical protein
MEQKVFKSGEKISYNIMYNLGFLWVNAGRVEFSVDSSQLNNKPVYIFKSSGISYSDYDWVMKIREVFMSYAECEPLKSIKFARKSIEGSYFASETYLFDYNHNYLYSEIENSNTRLFRDTFKLKTGTLDLLTAIYACRNIDFSKYKEGNIIPLYVLIDNKYESINIKFTGTDYYKIDIGKKLKCIKLSANLVAGTIFKSGDNMTILITDDKIHLPVYIETDILVGSVKAFLNSFSGLKK